jgi:hypothetical protein
MTLAPGKTTKASSPENAIELWSLSLDSVPGLTRSGENDEGVFPGKRDPVVVTDPELRGHCPWTPENAIEFWSLSLDSQSLDSELWSLSPNSGEFAYLHASAVVG